MEKEQGERWHCVNPVCGHEEVLKHAEAVARNQLRCACGAEMKKDYSPPVFRYLEFLRIGEPADSEAVAQEERK